MDAAPLRDGAFVACANTPAVAYQPGITAVSRSGTWQAELLSASTDTTSGTVDGAAVGLSTWTVDLSPAADAGTADGGADPQVTAPKPYMPIHVHFAPTMPTVVANGGGTYTVSEIDFFMSGYFQVTLNVNSGGTTADPIVFNICISP